mmetsp:Transcript_68167/g.197620  ORF Transcript_68167/g.197620 Transcript_68167/m.197620 type:complete len:332 (-) Transcript_68167:1041-2036(-)
MARVVAGAGRGAQHVHVTLPILLVAAGAGLRQHGAHAAADLLLRGRGHAITGHQPCRRGVGRRPGRGRRGLPCPPDDLRRRRRPPADDARHGRRHGRRRLGVQLVAAPDERGEMAPVAARAGECHHDAGGDGTAGHHARTYDCRRLGPGARGALRVVLGVVVLVPPLEIQQTVEPVERCGRRGVSVDRAACAAEPCADRRQRHQGAVQSMVRERDPVPRLCERLSVLHRHGSDELLPRPLPERAGLLRDHRGPDEGGRGLADPRGVGSLAFRAVGLFDAAHGRGLRRRRPCHIPQSGGAQGVARRSRGSDGAVEGRALARRLPSDVVASSY